MQNTIARVLAELLEENFKSHVVKNRDCRLLVPGLTSEIAGQLHKNLVKKGVTSYLVIDENEEPDKQLGRIRAVGLTSKRIGSFIVIVSPGQLAHIHDSIRGTGGTIRSTVFSEEWPWIDNGNEQFRFQGPVLNSLAEEWSDDQDQIEWIQKFTVGLVRSTSASPNRLELVLEDILGKFEPSNYSEIDDIREKLLFHSGVPRTERKRHLDIGQFIRSVRSLNQQIIDRCQKEQDIREQVNHRVDDVIPEEDRDKVKEALDIFLDGLGKSTMSAVGFLGFHLCWGAEKPNISNWRTLTYERLEKIFDLRGKPNGPDPKAKLDIAISCDRAVISNDRQKIATFVGEDIGLEIDYKIPETESTDTDIWEIQVKQLRREFFRKRVVNSLGEESVHLCTQKFRPVSTLKVEILKNGISNNSKSLKLYLCGENKPAFVLVEPNYSVVDAVQSDSEEVLDEKIEVDEPVNLYLFDYNKSAVLMHDEDDTHHTIIQFREDIWRSKNAVEVGTMPSGQVKRICKFDSLESVICLEAKELTTGEFTLEDELRLTIVNSIENRLSKLEKLFSGEESTPYSRLGNIDVAARRRIDFAKKMTDKAYFGDQPLPLCANLLTIDGLVDDDNMHRHNLSTDATQLIEAYSIARKSIVTLIESKVDSSGLSMDHPVYASHPIYSQKFSDQTERALVDYLNAYYKILDYLKLKQGQAEWVELFLLSYLDCVVHWGKNKLKNAVFLVGPWHPLVLAKRYMVQAALFSRARLILNKQDNKSYRHLATLLRCIQGFRWLVGVSADDRKLEHIYVTATSDPGWHLAFKTNCDNLAKEEEVGDLLGLFMKIRDNFGLSVDTLSDATDDLTAYCLRKFTQAYPSRRSIGVHFRSGYVENDILSNLTRYLRSEKGLTDQGKRLIGGLRLYFEEDPHDTFDEILSEPPFFVYQSQCDDWIQTQYPDINMFPSIDEMSFSSNSNDIELQLPSGVGLESVFKQPLNRLTEGQDLLPKSITCESNVSVNEKSGSEIGWCFNRVVAKAENVLSNSQVTVCEVHLPQKLKAPWVVIPGRGIDPAVLVKYVRDGEEKNIEDRALWDYKVNLAKSDTSFFVLSTIPKSFQVAVNGFFKKNNIANDFIVDLGKNGISIGGEALRSGRHTLGVIGLVGAVRLFQDSLQGIPPPIKCNSNAVGFLIPVDSFESFFGKTGSSQPDLGHKRSDLLAVQMHYVKGESQTLRIFCCGIESKFTSSTFASNRVNDALAQAQASSGDFKSLVKASLCNGAMPERLGLLEIIKFGLRITSPSEVAKIGEWLKRETEIYKSILTGNYEYYQPEYEAVLVTTEKDLPGVAEIDERQNGLWVRLTKGHWPGISETPQLSSIRQRLSNLFLSTQTERAPFREIPTTLAEQRQAELKPNDSSDETIAQEISNSRQIDQIFLGVDERRSSVHFNPQSPIDPLDNMNLMITGSSGTGKTQFLKYLICELREQDVPILIIDFKNDFASDSTFANKCNLDRIFVTFDGLPYNPLIPFPVKHPLTGESVIQPGQFIAGISSVLKQTYGLGVQQQAVVKNSIATAFSSSNINTSSGSIPYTEQMEFPDFSVVGESLFSENRLAYNRLDPLFTLGLFRNEFRNLSFESLVGRPVILDFSQIPSDEIKNALAQLIVLSAHAYYNSKPHSGTVRQLFVFDEAHRILKSDYLLRLVRECRAYGVGILLSSQFPSDFPSDVSASMATKVIHGNGSDSDRVKGIMQIIGCEGRESDAASLERFQAFVNNRHYPQTIIRTMNYPLYLVWAQLNRLGRATRAELSKVTGIDTLKLPISNLVQQLELLGLAEEREGTIYLLDFNK